MGHASFTLTIPNARTAAKRRLPAYISASTTSVSVTVSPGNLTSTAPLSNCASVNGGRACTFTVAAPIGSDTFALQLLDANATVLSAGTTVPVTVTEGTSNVSVPLILGGVPATVDVTAAGAVPGQPGTIPLFVTAYDADGNAIIGPAPYVDKNGSADALTVSRADTISGNPLYLQDGGNSGGSISVTAPTDAPQLVITSATTALGSAFTVGNSTGYLPARTQQAVAFSGTLTATTVASAGLYADDDFYAPSSTLAGGPVNGFVFGRLNGGGGSIGYYNTANATSLYACTLSGSNSALSATAVPGGFVIGYSGDPLTITPPWGLQYLATSAFATGSTPACGAANQYETDTLNPTTEGPPKALAFDGSAIDEGSTASGPPVTHPIRSIALSGTTLGPGNTQLLGLSSTPTSIVGNGTTIAFAIGGSTFSTYSPLTGAVTSLPVGGTAPTITSLATAFGRIYGLDTTNHIVFSVIGGIANETPSRSMTGTFSISLGANPWHLAVGPDGNFYAIDNNQTVEQQPATGLGTTATLPGVSQGGVVAVFDGHDGYVYAVVGASLGNTLLVDRVGY